MFIFVTNTRKKLTLNCKIFITFCGSNIAGKLDTVDILQLNISYNPSNFFSS